jgi:hypothetical protein
MDIIGTEDVQPLEFRCIRGSVGPDDIRESLLDFGFVQVMHPTYGENANIERFIRNDFGKQVGRDSESIED